MQRINGGRVVDVVYMVVLTITLLLVRAEAGAVPEGRIVKVDKPVSTAALAQAGMLFLADLGDAYLVQGTRVAGRRLSGLTGGVEVLSSLSPGKAAYLLRPASFAAEIRYSGALVKVGEGTYLANLDAEDVSDFTLLPFSKVRLTPCPFPGRLFRKHRNRECLQTQQGRSPEIKRAARNCIDNRPELR